MDSPIILSLIAQKEFCQENTYELVNNDRVIGGLNIESTNKCRDFYKTFVNNLNLKCRNCRIIKIN